MANRACCSAVYDRFQRIWFSGGAGVPQRFKDVFRYDFLPGKEGWQ
ncbi:kelch repeat-containing protein [Paenibacillus algorifonticola]